MVDDHSFKTRAGARPTAERLGSVILMSVVLLAGAYAAWDMFRPRRPGSAPATRQSWRPHRSDSGPSCVEPSARRI